jgi:alpha-D-ribose 1-methylphosphonate 5-triphosphate diphosphatase
MNQHMKDATVTPDRTMVVGDARIVLRDRVIEHGWLVVSGGRIAEVGEGAAPRGATSFEGDMLIPGLVELHTDHLETHIQPRPKVHWPIDAALQAYDLQIAGSGITTVYDCLRVGVDGDNEDVAGDRVIAVAEALGRAGAAGALRVEHHTHLRCEVCSSDVIEALDNFLARCPARLISIMDHTPGQRQFRDLEKLRTYYRGKLSMSESELDVFFAKRIALHEANSDRHRRAIVERARKAGIKIASHDDTTLEHVAESLGDGVAIAEFPTTAEAARASAEGGIAVMMGAPNIIRGGSHSGNVAAIELARAGTLDVLSSDYVPASLLHAAFELPRLVAGFSLPAAIATVTANPATAAGLDDRGVIEAGRRADLVRVQRGPVPVVRGVWRGGIRVC